MRCDKCGKRFEDDWTPQEIWPKYEITQRCGVLSHITQINLCDECSVKLKNGWRKKMRLINANELKQWLNGYLESDNLSPTYVRTLIDNRPTINAIPIEWIEERACRFDSPEAKDLVETLCFRYVLNTWREENETESE